jgi:hypothetical protein
VCELDDHQTKKEEEKCTNNNIPLADNITKQKQQ